MDKKKDKYPQILQQWQDEGDFGDWYSQERLKGIQLIAFWNQGSKQNVKDNFTMVSRHIINYAMVSPNEFSAYLREVQKNEPNMCNEYEKILQTVNDISNKFSINSFEESILVTRISAKSPHKFREKTVREYSTKLTQSLEYIANDIEIK